MLKLIRNQLFVNTVFDDRIVYASFNLDKIIHIYAGDNGDTTVIVYGKQKRKFNVHHKLHEIQIAMEK